MRHRLCLAMGAVSRDNSSPGTRAVPVCRLCEDQKLGIAPNINHGCDCDCMLQAGTATPSQLVRACTSSADKKFLS